MHNRMHGLNITYIYIYIYIYIILPTYMCWNNISIQIYLGGLSISTLTNIPKINIYRFKKGLHPNFPINIALSSEKGTLFKH